MDTTERIPTSSEAAIESKADEVSSDGHSLVSTKKERRVDNEQILDISSISDQIVDAEVKSTHNDQPASNSENTPESSSSNDLTDSKPTNEGNEEDDMDSTSEISDFSDFSQESWHPVQGPIAWVQEQMRQGQNARSILEDLVPPGTMIPDDIDPIMLWRLIINIVSEPPKRKKLENINTLEDVISLMKTCQKIIVLTGAGVSVSCGIPDFRSRDGVYARLAVDFPNLPDPQAMFDIRFFRSDPRPFFKFAKEIYPGQFKPSLCHHFIRLIESQGKLLRNYTQNIDTLEQEAGIERVVQCHGSFATATCTNCKLKVKADVVREDIFKQVIPKCPQCPEGTENAIMKPDIVFFGESLPEDFHKQMAQDKDECDLLIVIGSSLKVRPVALIPNSVPPHVPQILINRERLRYLNFDVELLGNCDDIVGELCHRLGSGWDQLAPATASPLTEVVMSSLPTPPTSPQNPATFSSSSPSSIHTEQEKATAVAVKKNTKVNNDIDHTSQSSAFSASVIDTSASPSVDEENKVEEKSSTSMDCTGSGNKEEIVREDKNTTNPSSSTSSVGTVSSSNLQASHSCLIKSDKEEQASTSNALTDEVSTTSASAKSSHHLSADNSRVKIQQDEECTNDKDNSESDTVSSTSNEHNKVHHHKQHHHHHHSSHHHHNHNHSHHHHHHHHSHHHKHHGHQHHHHHRHHHHSSSSSKSLTSEHQTTENENCSDVMEPVEKRPRLDEEKAVSPNTAASGDDNNLTSSTTAAVSEQMEELKDEVDDELEEMRKMWQGRRNRVSLAQRLAENQYLFLPPNRYVFKGAEVFTDSEEEDDSDDNNNSDDDAGENNVENSNDISGEADELEEQQQTVEIEETPLEIDEMPLNNSDLSGEATHKDGSTASPSLKPSLTADSEDVDDKDKTGIVSFTNTNGN